MSQIVTTNLELCTINDEHEIARKAIDISPDGLFESFCADTVQFRQIAIQHDLLAADEIDRSFDFLNRNKR